MEGCPHCGKALHHPVSENKHSKPANIDSTGVFTLSGTDAQKVGVAQDSLSQNRKASSLAESEIKNLGPYRIVRNIGRGGMGFVYEAVDTRLNRQVALKTVEINLDKHLIERFREEARNAARLRHPNIVSVHDVGRDGGFDYFTMDLVDGVTLEEWLKKVKTSIPERIRIIEKVARALHYSHQQGIIHRDMKPGNIMIDHHREPQIMDFGLARNTKDTHSLTLGGTIVGTPAYMSPEQAMGASSDIGPGVDIWALGVVMYDILAGESAFDNGNVYQTIYSVLHDEPESLRKLNPEIPLELELIVFKCLEKQSSRRYRTVDVLADDLKAWLEGNPISVRPLTWWEKLKKKLTAKRAISMQEFILEQEARQKSEAEKIELQTRLENESRKKWNLVLEENLTHTSVESRWEIIGSWAIKEGELKLSDAKPQILYLKQSISGDVRIEFTCRQEGDDLGDISCFMSALSLTNRKKACNTGYMFQFGGEGNTRTFLERAGERLWERAESPIIRGVTYRVCAEKKDSRLSFWVNDKLIFEVDDPQPLSGMDRYLVGFYGWKTETWYSDIKIYKLGASVKADILDMAHRQLEKGSYEVAKCLFQETLDSTEDPLRLEQAKRGLEIIQTRLDYKEKFTSYKKTLLEHWPQAKLDLTDQGFELNISFQDIRELTPIAGMKLERLFGRGNEVSSLEPLRGMPLKILDMGLNKIVDLTPLQGLSLEDLTIMDNNIQSLEPLRDMRLQILRASGNKEIRNWNVLRDISLFRLSCSRSELTNLNFLEGMNLSILDADINQITDLSPLRHLPLTSLTCQQNQLTSLEPLRGMKRLRNLDIAINPITSLEPLEGIDFIELNCWNIPITSLEPFIENPPQEFYFDCETLPNSELARAIKIWSQHPKSLRQAQIAKILLAIRENDRQTLKSLSTGIDGSYFLFIPHFLSWHDSRKICQSLGGDLAVIRNKTVLNYIQKTRLPSRSSWVGAKLEQPTSSQDFVWIDGTRIEGMGDFESRNLIKSFPVCAHWSTIHGLEFRNDISGLPFFIEWKK